jgi:hypothetical protein
LIQITALARGNAERQRESPYQNFLFGTSGLPERNRPRSRLPDWPGRRSLPSTHCSDCRGAVTNDGALFFRGEKNMTCRDQLVEKLRKVTLDGSEIFHIVDAELKNAEDEIAASNIRHAILSQYRDVVPLDAVIEVVGEWLESESPFERTQFTYARE